MNPISFRYYIPAYMVWSLKNYKTSDCLTANMTIDALELHDVEEVHDLHRARFSLLDHDQSRAVSLFLQFMVNNHEGFVDYSAAKKALSDYWEEFL